MSSSVEMRQGVVEPPHVIGRCSDVPSEHVEVERVPGVEEAVLLVMRERSAFAAGDVPANPAGAWDDALTHLGGLHRVFENVPSVEFPALLGLGHTDLCDLHHRPAVGP